MIRTIHVAPLLCRPPRPNNSDASGQSLGFSQAPIAVTIPSRYTNMMTRRSVLSVLIVALLLLSVEGASVALGTFHTCALLDNNGKVLGHYSTITCWGNNKYGQLGDGTTTDRTTPVVVSGITTATSIATGGAHTCAVTFSGTMKCWGWNSFSQLGDGTTTTRNTPVDTPSSVSSASRYSIMAALVVTIITLSLSIYQPEP